MSPPKKTLEQYEAEATWIGGCWISPTGHARHIYMMRHGPLATEQYVCHTCDTPKCINDDHHFVGTSQDNVRDAVAKGRHSSFRKGGVRFSGPHTEETKKIISAASFRMWEKRRANT